MALSRERGWPYTICTVAWLLKYQHVYNGFLKMLHISTFAALHVQQILSTDINMTSASGNSQKDIQLQSSWLSLNLSITFNVQDLITAFAALSLFP